MPLALLRHPLEIYKEHTKQIMVIKKASADRRDDFWYNKFTKHINEE